MMAEPECAETLPLRKSIGELVGNLEQLSSQIYEAKELDIKPGLDIRTLPEYGNVIFALVSLKKSASRKYHLQNNIPLD